MEELVTQVNGWIDRYNKVITGLSDFDKQRNGRYAKDVSGGYGEQIGALLQDFDGFQEDLGVLGFTDATQYTDILRTLQRGISDGNQFMSQFADEDAYNQYLNNPAEYQRQQGLWTNQDDLLVDAREQKANGGYDALEEQIRQETWAYYSKHGDEYVQDYLDNHTMDYLPAASEPDYSQYISPDSPYYNIAKDYLDRQMGEYGQSPKAKPTVKPVDVEERNADAQKVNKLVREKDRIDYVDKYTGKEYKDNFFGQFGGNYTVGRITQDSSLAWNEYLDNPTEENLRYAQTIDQMATEVQRNNADVLQKERRLSIISKDFANYLPQLADQIKYEAVGAVAGAAGGFAIAATTGYVPAIGKGVKAGITAASGVYSYQTMRGAAFKSLLEAGADEETARMAANNEAIISSIIEMGETAISLVLTGGGKAIDAVTGGLAAALKSQVEEIVGKNMATKFMAGLFGYLANIGSEWLEEATQESVSIANENDPDAGFIGLAKNAAGTFFDAVTNKDSENRDRVLEAGEGGARLAFLMGGAEAGTNAAITKAATNFYANRIYGQNPGALVQRALEGNPESVLAKNLQTKLESGKKLTGSELAKLAGETENSFRDQQRSAIATAVKQRLNEVGETGDVETIATAIAKKVMGEELNLKENHAFKNSSIGDMVLREMSQQKRESPGNNGWRNAAEYAKQEDLSVMDALNRAGLSGSADLARANPQAYGQSFQNALKGGASYDQALIRATSDSTMRIVGNQVPMGTLLYNIGGDTNKAISAIGGALNRAEIRMTPGELKLLGIVAAEASAYQQDPSFQRDVAIEMLKQNSKEAAWTAASEKLWQEATDRVIAYGIADAISRDVGQEQLNAIDTETIPQYNEGNGQEVADYGSGETNQGVLRQGYPVGAEGRNPEITGAVKDGDAVFPGEGLSEGRSGRILSLSDSRGITEQEYDDDFDHFDGKAGIDTEGKSIPEESAKHLLGTTVVDGSGAPIAVYHGTPEMDFTTFEKGDTGFHFGTYEQASKRIADRGEGTGRIFRTYLNIQKPLYASYDIGQWDAGPLAMYLHAMQTLTDAEYEDIHNLLSKDIGYDSDAAVHLREILTEKGYDGLVYPNSFEGQGDSYMVFRDDQIIRSEITYFGSEGEKKQQSKAIPTADEDSSNPIKGWIVDENVEADDTKQGELIIGKSLSAKAKNYRVYDPKSDKYFLFVEGSHIRNPKIFAGKGGVKPLRPEVIEGLTREYPTDKPSNWQHCKGIGTLDFFGEERDAEVHWFQEESAGKHKFKIKRWIE